MTLCHTCRKSCEEPDRKKAEAEGMCKDYEDNGRERGGLLDQDWVW